MCGIVGLHRLSGCDGATIEGMRDRLAHRGPDDAGLWLSPDCSVGLGQRRLSIIDLTAAGHLPMTNEDGSLWLVFNGEIYNHADLRAYLQAHGHVFRSRSDAETILHGYEEWGWQCVRRLRGMFAFALWDGRARRLWLVRDHTGIKPLFYYSDGTTFAFASEIKALLGLPQIDRSIDRSAVFDYLTYLYVPAPKTAYLRIRKLQPGHYLSLDDGGIRCRQYWDVPLEQDPAITEPQAVRQVQETLHEAVRLSMVSDVPVGLFLSGGIDSSTVAAEMTRLTDERVRSFSIGFDVAEHSEIEYARAVAGLFDTAHSERTVGREAVQVLLPRLAGIYDEPYCDGSAMPTLRVSELAREQVKVVLSGDGGDEVFAGYTWYDRWLRWQRVGGRIPAVLRNTVLAGLGRRWPGQVRGAALKRFLLALGSEPFEQYAQLMELFSPSEKRALLSSEWADEFRDYDDYWYLREYWKPQLDPITRLQYLDVKTYLPDDILTKVDRATMAVGLEARPPLLDHVLIETVFRVPAEVRFRNGEKKYLLKQAMRDVLPSGILDRPKKGFSSPLMTWLRQERSWANRWLADSARVARADCMRRVERLNWGPKVWALLVLEQWARNIGF